MIYFVIVNYYSTDLVYQLFSSFPTESQIPYKLIVINNSPEDSSIYQLESDLVHILKPLDNLGFGAACNLGLQKIYNQNPQALVWLINPDTSLLEKPLEKVVELFKKYPEISIAGTIVYTEDGEIWSAGGHFNPYTGSIQTQNSLQNEANQNLNQDYFVTQWVTGCSLIINLSNFHTCPQFDPAYFLYYEDFDFCKRYSEQGHLIVVVPNIGIVHRPSSITNRNVANKLKFSTYSYLITLQKYTHLLILMLRLARILLSAIILLPVKPTMTVGKMYGIFLFFKTCFFNRTSKASAPKF